VRAHEILQIIDYAYAIVASKTASVNRTVVCPNENAAYFSYLKLIVGDRNKTGATTNSWKSVIYDAMFFSESAGPMQVIFLSKGLTKTDDSSI